ncbi:uncharacterized protein M6B38_297540 [Iris pallida]|uniref:Uncharacterized protein n=1 Tax=Iris pallida TaxID=29817 RepID=A0AAX6HSL8_IRIPA|nr:uncharacterized protein M6B38_169855 [Iris pallida]KAJ6843703.1 uncharacterized protein M6B38_297540 [Iris pallida]
MMYSANCDKECLGIGKFVRLAHLMHSMTDEELFWRASIEPRRDDCPFRRVPKVASMFLTRGSGTALFHFCCCHSIFRAFVTTDGSRPATPPMSRPSSCSIRSPHVC